MKIFCRAAFMFLGLALTACSTPPPASGDMASPHGRSHALNGKIWDVKAARIISAQDLAGALGGHDFILLGETHDNPDHHRLQAWILQALADRNHLPAVAFEMIGLDKADALKVYQETNRYNADGLDAFLDWSASGWPDWEIYKPVFDRALFNGARLAAANLSEAMVKDMSKRGREALPEDLRQELHLIEPIPAPLRQAMAGEIQDGHCGGLPARLIPAFVDIQFSRDALMAQSLIKADTGQGAVLIAGSGHTRTDHGVPWHLGKMANKKSVASVAFVEVSDDKPAPENYAADWNSTSPPFDYIWFTGRTERADPCAIFTHKPGKN